MSSYRWSSHPQIINLLWHPFLWIISKTYQEERYPGYQMLVVFICRRKITRRSRDHDAPIAKRRPVLRPLVWCFKDINCLTGLWSQGRRTYNSVWICRLHVRERSAEGQRNLWQSKYGEREVLKWTYGGRIVLIPRKIFWLLGWYSIIQWAYFEAWGVEDSYIVTVRVDF